MKRLLLALLTALPACAAAQGRGRPPETDQVELTSAFSGREGFASRSAGFKASLPLGRPGGPPLTFSAEAAHLRTRTAGYFPGELYDTGFSLRTRGRKFSLRAGARSNSDRPFNSRHETDASLDASVTISSSGPHSFLLGLNYSSQRSFLRGVPFPYISYSYITEKLSIFFPFSLKWKPERNWEFSASYFPPRYFSASLSRAFSPAFSLALTGGLQMNQYLLADRPDKEYSLFLEQPHAGLRASLKPAAGWEVAPWASWGFKGRYFTGRKYSEHIGRTGVGAGPSAGLSLKKNF